MKRMLTMGAALTLASSMVFARFDAAPAGAVSDQTDVTLIANSKTHTRPQHARRSHGEEWRSRSEEWRFMIGPDPSGPHDLGG